LVRQSGSIPVVASNLWRYGCGFIEAVSGRFCLAGFDEATAKRCKRFRIVRVHFGVLKQQISSDFGATSA
tara:strand:+ start:552 stop:761 length:210 start_codon:yes stop_codon:yes gene_type:complete